MQNTAHRKAVAFPRIPVRGLIHATTLTAFGWLLAQDAIQPLAVYLLQLFLSF